jgi:hypothetical protein
MWSCDIPETTLWNIASERMRMLGGAPSPRFRLPLIDPGNAVEAIGARQISAGGQTMVAPGHPL